MPEHPTPQESIDYVLRIDRHAPLHTPRAREIIDRVRPHWLVHEFIPTDTTDWEEKLAAQTAAIR